MEGIKEQYANLLSDINVKARGYNLLADVEETVARQFLIDAAQKYPNFVNSYLEQLYLLKKGREDLVYYKPAHVTSYLEIYYGEGQKAYLAYDNTEGKAEKSYELDAIYSNDSILIEVDSRIAYLQVMGKILWNQTNSANLPDNLSDNDLLPDDLFNAKDIIYSKIVEKYQNWLEGDRN